MDTTNRQGVGVIGGDVAVVMPRTRMTPDEAMMFAAWLVTMAQMQKPDLPAFVAYINAVQS